MVFLLKFTLNCTILQYHKLLLRFSFEGFMTRESLSPPPILKEQGLCRTCQFSKENFKFKFALKAFVKCVFTFTVLVWIYFIISHWTISAGFWDKMIFLPRLCFLPMYIEAIYFSVIFSEVILAFLLRDRLHWKEADQ